VSFATAPLNSSQSERDLLEALGLTRAMPWPAGESFVLWESAAWLGFRGRYAYALEHAEASLHVAERIEHRQWMVGALWSLGVLYADLLAPERATPVLERALGLATELASEMWMPLVGAALALAHVASGKLADAHVVLTRVLGPDSAVESMSPRQAWAARVELALAPAGWPCRAGDPRPVGDIRARGRGRAATLVAACPRAVAGRGDARC
jgi:hypothetical protein